MKILGIHGRATIVGSQNTDWGERANDIRSRWHQIYIPQFDASEDPRYEVWKSELDDIDIDAYDAFLAVSHGSWVFARYIIENKLRLKRVVFCCPGRWLAKREHTWEVYDYLESNDVNLKKYVDEVYIVHGLDDDVVPYSEWEKFLKQVGGEMYALEDFWHKLNGEAITFINDLVISWKQ